MKKNQMLKFAILGVAIFSIATIIVCISQKKQDVTSTKEIISTETTNQNTHTEKTEVFSETETEETTGFIPPVVLEVTTPVVIHDEATNSSNNQGEISGNVDNIGTHVVANQGDSDTTSNKTTVKYKEVEVSVVAPPTRPTRPTETSTSTVEDKSSVMLPVAEETTKEEEYIIEEAVTVPQEVISDELADCF